MMKPIMVDVELELNKETIDALKGMSKKQLRNRFCEIALKCHIAEKKAEAMSLRCKMAIEDADRAQKEVEQLRTKLNKAETYLEQGRAIINAVINRWHEYDVY